MLRYCALLEQLFSLVRDAEALKLLALAVIFQPDVR